MMSWGIDLFVGAELPLPEFVRQIEALLSLPPMPPPERENKVYAGEYEGALVWVGEHELENDRDMRFEDYRFQITFWPYRHWETTVQERWLSELAPALFARLRQAYGYPLLLTEEVQRKLDEFAPHSDLSR